MRPRDKARIRCAEGRWVSCAGSYSKDSIEVFDHKIRCNGDDLPIVNLYRVLFGRDDRVGSDVASGSLDRGDMRGGVAMVIGERPRAGKRESEGIEELLIVGEAGERKHPLAAQLVGNRQLDSARQDHISEA